MKHKKLVIGSALTLAVGGTVYLTRRAMAAPPGFSFSEMAVDRLGIVPGGDLYLSGTVKNNTGATQRVTVTGEFMDITASTDEIEMAPGEEVDYLLILRDNKGTPGNIHTPAVRVDGASENYPDVAITPKHTMGELGWIWAGGDKLVGASNHGDWREVLYWGSVVLDEYSIGHGLDNKGQNVLPDRLRSQWLDTKPKRFWGLGHGSPTVFTVDNLEHFFEASGKNLDLVDGCWVHLQSCETAQQLGHAIIDAGASGYIGYYNPFWLVRVRGKDAGCARFITASEDCDRYMEDLLDEGITSPDTLLARGKDRFDGEIGYWEENYDKEEIDGKAVSEHMANILITVLTRDREALRVYA